MFAYVTLVVLGGVVAFSYMRAIEFAEIEWNLSISRGRVIVREHGPAPWLSGLRLRQPYEGEGRINPKYDYVLWDFVLVSRIDNGSYFVTTVSLLPIVAALFIPLIWIMTQRTRRKPDICSRCGYDIRSCTNRRCSECGLLFL